MDDKLKTAEINWRCAREWTLAMRGQRLKHQTALVQAEAAHDRAQAAEEAARLEFKRLGGKP